MATFNIPLFVSSSSSPDARKRSREDGADKTPPTCLCGAPAAVRDISKGTATEAHFVCATSSNNPSAASAGCTFMEPLSATPAAKRHAGAVPMDTSPSPAPAPKALFPQKTEVKKAPCAGCATPLPVRMSRSEKNPGYHYICCESCKNSGDSELRSKAFQWLDKPAAPGSSVPCRDCKAPLTVKHAKTGRAYVLCFGPSCKARNGDKEVFRWLDDNNRPENGNAALREVISNAPLYGEPIHPVTPGHTADHGDGGHALEKLESALKDKLNAAAGNPTAPGSHDAIEDQRGVIKTLTGDPTLTVVLHSPYLREFRFQTLYLDDEAHDIDGDAYVAPRDPKVPGNVLFIVGTPSPDVKGPIFPGVDTHMPSLILFRDTSGMVYAVTRHALKGFLESRSYPVVDDCEYRICSVPVLEIVQGCPVLRSFAPRAEGV